MNPQEGTTMEPIIFLAGSVRLGEATLQTSRTPSTENCTTHRLAIHEESKSRSCYGSNYRRKASLRISSGAFAALHWLYGLGFRLWRRPSSGPWNARTTALRDRWLSGASQARNLSIRTQVRWVFLWTTPLFQNDSFKEQVQKDVFKERYSQPR